MKKQTPSLITNVASSLAVYGVSIVVTFLISPFVIHTLGDSRYGVWSLVADMVGYYGFFDLGIRGAVSHFVARYSARHEADNLKGILSSAFWSLSALGIVVLGAGVALVAAFPLIFNAQGVDLTEIRHTLLIMSVAIALNLPMGSFSAALVGYRRLDLVNIVEGTNKVLVAVAVYVVLKQGGGLVEISIIHAVSRAVTWCAMAYNVRRCAGGLFIQLHWFRRLQLKELGSYGFRNAISQVSNLVISRTDLIVVGIFMDVKWVTYYTLGSTLVTYSSSACFALIRSFAPHFSHRFGKSDEQELRRLYFIGLRTSSLLAAGLVAGLLVFGKPFIALWVGDSYVTGAWTLRSDVVLLILLSAELPRLLQGASRQFLYATARVRFMMWLNLSEAIANLGLSLVLVQKFQLAGVAFGTLFPLLISHGIVLPAYIFRTLNVSVSEFLFKGVGRPVLVGVVMTAAGLTIVNLSPPDSWAVFFSEVTLTATTGALLGFGIGISSEERQAIRRWLANRLVPSGRRGSGGRDDSEGN